MADQSLTIDHAASGTRARIAPTMGFNCYSWQSDLGGETVELLWHDPKFLVGQAKPTRSGIPILFPFSGRLRGTSLTFEGRNYDVGDTLDDLGNPIHGFVLNRPWRVIEHAPDRIVGQFQASVDEPSLVDRWPADFRITLSYQVSAGTLRTEIEVHNPDTRLLPFGFGTHPYFRMPIGKDGDMNKCVLKVPAYYHWDLDESLLPLPQLTATPLVEKIQAGLPLGDANLDDLLTALTFENDICTASVDDASTSRRLTVTFGKQFANCVVFIPPHREAVCIEPYTTSPDPFRMQTMGVDANLQLLAPGKTWKAWVEMRVAGS